MPVSFENKELTTVLTFTISQEQIKPAFGPCVWAAKKTLNVPGFRKGHIPRPIFNQRFGEEALYQDALNDLLPVAYEAAVKEAGIEVVAQPTSLMLYLWKKVKTGRWQQLLSQNLK